MRISGGPILQIEKKPFDKYLDTLALLLALSLFAIPFNYYSILPESIPIHFNSRGEADGYGSKKIIWFIPIIGFAIHLLFKWLNKRPHVLNYPVKITKENAQAQYSMCLRVLRIVDVLMLLLFTSIVYQICTASVNGMKEAYPWYTIVFILSILVVLILYFYRSKKVK